MFILQRLREPSTWAAIASVVAIGMGKDPLVVSDAVLQLIGGLAALVGVFMSESNSNK